MIFELYVIFFQKLNCYVTFTLYLNYRVFPETVPPATCILCDRSLVLIKRECTLLGTIS